MPDSFQGLATFVIGLLPGAIYIWAFERELGSWGQGAADRVFRFIGVSALFQVFFLPVLFLVWAARFRGLESLEWQEALYMTVVRQGAWWILLLPITYVGIPMAVGVLAAYSVTRARRTTSRIWPFLARLLAGRDPAPTAWDNLFSARPSGLIRLELSSGQRIGGVFSTESYAAGYPEKPQDLYMERELRVDQESGEFFIDGDGNYEELGAGVLVRWDNVRILEFFEDESEEEDGDL